MISFHNDHLVSPELCKLLYETIPERIHLPVVFVPHTERWRTGGSCYWDHIELYLQGIFHNGFRRCYGSIDFSLWKQMLYVAYHEFGHLATFSRTEYRDNAYEEDRNFKFNVEELADDWANKMLLNLAEHDKRLFQPIRLGPYFDGRMVKAKTTFRKDLPHPWLKNYRCFKSGGQFSTGDVAKMCAAGPWSKPNTRLIRRLADDLSYKYIDRAGRKQLFFAWGDIPEIMRRVEGFQRERKTREKQNSSVPF